jgi:uncharacterized protein YhbP (UPF0306 family)
MNFISNGWEWDQQIVSESDDLSAVRLFLESQSTLALATLDAAGHPQIAPLFYVSDEALNLYWLSSSTSRHSVNLTANEHVAATIYPDVWKWTDIRGLQIEGQAQAVTDDELRTYMLNAYRQKFTLPAEFELIITNSTLYVLTPTWIRWLDNSVKFGYKAEITPH